MKQNMQKKFQVRGSKERRREAYECYDERLNDDTNEVSELFKRILL